MVIEITHVRYGGTTKSEDQIIGYKWLGVGNGQNGESDTATLVDWVEEAGEAYVGNGPNRVGVSVVRPENGAPYLRTHVDGEWTNNLLSLPTF